MKINRKQLRQIIQEEISSALLENFSNRAQRLESVIATAGDKSSTLDAELTATTSDLESQTQKPDPTDPDIQQQRKVDDEEISRLDRKIEKNAMA